MSDFETLLHLARSSKEGEEWYLPNMSAPPLFGLTMAQMDELKTVLKRRGLMLTQMSGQVFIKRMNAKRQWSH